MFCSFFFFFFYFFFYFKFFFFFFFFFFFLFFFCIYFIFVLFCFLVFFFYFFNFFHNVNIHYLCYFLMLLRFVFWVLTDVKKISFISLKLKLNCLIGEGIKIYKYFSISRSVETCRSTRLRARRSRRLWSNPSTWFSVTCKIDLEFWSGCMKTLGWEWKELSLASMSTWI